MLKLIFLKLLNCLGEIPILKEFEWFEWFEWFGPSPIEPFNSGRGPRRPWRQERRGGARSHLPGRRRSSHRLYSKKQLHVLLPSKTSQGRVFFKQIESFQEISTENNCEFQAKCLEML